MKKIYIKSLFAALAIICFTGCTKDLDLIPKDTLSDAMYWTQASDFEKGANALYSVLPRPSTADLNSDIAFTYPNSVSNSTLTTPETDGNWNNAYVQIRNCNNLIEKASVSPIAAEIKVSVAEAKFFRAYNYWSLYRLYGGVPVITKVLDINSEELYGTRNSAQETVDFILQNLREAAPDLPEENQVPATSRGRITRGAANAFLARIALFEGTWRKYRNEAGADSYLDMAVSAAGTVINSGQYALFTGEGADSYLKLFDYAGDNVAENILTRKYQYLVDYNNAPQLFQQMGYLPTKQLADMYVCSDGLPVDRSPLFKGYEMRTSEFENRDPRMSQTLMIPGTVAYAPLQIEPLEHWPFYPDRVYTTGYILRKFMTQNPENAMMLQTGIDHHIIRYAEVLLIYAEALYEKNGSISDDDLNKTVNQLRQRGGLNTLLTNAFVTANGLNMRDEIRRERTVELALEGFRRDDLRRWKTAEIELKKAIRGIKIVGTQWGTEPIMVQEQEKNVYMTAEYQSRADAEGFYVSEAASARSGFTDKNYLMPLPTKEIQLNPNLQQNPGW
ncbi:MAG: RagB/SusD family nutrient uptake outer membrane protein [Tannerella sp.]|jgi:hypothetical protein|nr:RagB/SusD family nutrient uptake outer membrane protein [Tannerella sp.]